MTNDDEPTFARRFIPDERQEAHYQEVAKLRLELATMERRAKDAELTAASMISALRPVLSSQFRGDNPVWACGKLVDYIEDMRGTVEGLEDEVGILKAIRGKLEEQNATLLTLIRRVIDHCPFCRNGTCRAETHAWLREALE